jgi:rubrerythrin
VSTYDEVYKFRQELNLETELLKGKKISLKEYTDAEKIYDNQFEELKRKSMFKCPHCGKGISRLEIDDG